VDSGGVGKGLAADRVAAELASCPTFCVDCCGDMRIGGTAGAPRTVSVAHPFTGESAGDFELSAGAVATSGVTKRAWFGLDGEPRHHLIDPRTGEPARTGVAQATALAPTATEAETLAKAALLAGPADGAGWLPHGGALVLSDGAVRRVEARELSPSRAA
jgi:thiamine biosynthesis lipoprotein